MAFKTTVCFLLGVLSVNAQTLAPLSASEPLVVTNRDVFKETTALVPIRKSAPTPYRRDLRGEVLDCRSNVVVVRTFMLKNVYGPVVPSTLPRITGSSNPLHQPPITRAVVGQKKNYGATVSLQNYPGAPTATNGQTIICGAITSGTFIWEGSLLALYDYVPAPK